MTDYKNNATKLVVSLTQDYLMAIMVRWKVGYRKVAQRVLKLDCCSRLEA
jgi:hypothetical protein